MKVIYKPWGREEWLELNERYCYKRIYLNAGYKTSFQYHLHKIETNYLISGTAEIWLENDHNVIEKKIMNAGDYFNVSPPKKHRVIAITDVILQEVSTPEIDDVIRLEDDTHRPDGKILKEHQSPAVLILTAGMGSRLGNLTTHINKALIPINNKSVISYIIEKFPKEYEIIVSVGYKKESLQEYCTIAHPDRKFTFIPVENINGPNSGPGYSALTCKDKLQRPFYFITSDCIIDSDLPHLDGNWLGIYPTSYPEKYSTIKIDENDNITTVVNKKKDGFNNAFIGLAGILDYDVFWKELEENIVDGEIISAFYNPTKYPTFKVKQLKWLDTGNLDDLSYTKKYFNDSPLSLYKTTGEIIYKTDKLIKFNPDTTLIKRKSLRARALGNLIPSEYNNTEFFTHYKWENGKTLYSYDSENIYNRFLEFFYDVLDKSQITTAPKEIFSEFYIQKSMSRKQQFIDRFGSDYYTQKHMINGIEYASLESILENISFDTLYGNPIYDKFHGDLQFDNVLYDDITDKFTYIDWRDSFGPLTSGGDLYYDLAKLYGGCIIPYNMMKQDSFIQYQEGIYIVNYKYNCSPTLHKFKTTYEHWLMKHKFHLHKIKFITALIFMNMSPLHDDKFSKMLWFKCIEMLTNDNK